MTHYRHDSLLHSYTTTSQSHLYTKLLSRKYIARLLLPILFIISFPFTTIHAQATPSVSIQSLSPSSTVTPGTAVSFSVVSSGFNSSLLYTLSDSQSQTTITNSHINSSGVFSWIPNSSDAGTHTLTITVTDESGTSLSLAQSIIVVNPTLTILSVSPGSSVNVGQTVFFSTAVGGLTNPTYSISDSLVASSIYYGNINSAGNFTWTPKSQDVGTHTITVNATDSSGRIATASQSITVGAEATATIQSLLPGNTVVFGQNVTATLSTTGFTSPTFSISDSFYGGTLSSSNLTSGGTLQWTPKSQDIGTHVLTILVQDSLGNRASVTCTITVQDSSFILRAVSPSNTIRVGTELHLYASTTGFIDPTYSLSDSFSGSSLSSAYINSSGNVLWTPRVQDVGSHAITLYARDGSGHTSTLYSTILVLASSTTSTQTQSISLQNTTTPRYTFTKYVALNSSGEEVLALQNFLNQKGFLSAVPTGTFGPRTEDAVKKFQISEGLSPLGVVGPATRNALNNYSQNSSTKQTVSTQLTPYVFTKYLTLGSSNSEVTALQNKLTTIGFYSGPISGYYGQLTMLSVKKFQLHYSISPTGSVGPATRNALNK